MSMSTQHGGGGKRQPSAVSTGSPGKKSASGKSAPAKSGAAKSDTGTPDAAKPDAGAAKPDAGAAKPDAGAAKPDAGAAKAAGATKSAGAKSTGSTKSTGAAKTAGPAKSTGPKTSGKGGGGGRRPIAPVKVNQRNWGPIVLFTAVGLAAAAIIGYGGYYVYEGSQSWADKANGISGIVNYREKDPGSTKQGVHQQGAVKYKESPPVGGPHNNSWQRCLGDVYDAPIANEHAVHSMEHGAVWVTYRPDLPAAQVEQLAAKVRGNDYLLMSPYEGLDKPISLQAWGYQLKVDNASDKRIDEFILDLKQNATMEPGVTCSSGNYVTATGTAPREMPAPEDPNAQMPGVDPNAVPGGGIAPGGEPPAGGAGG